jgi:hypothetical protein
MRWINTKVVWDIESGAVLEKEGFWYNGPVAECVSSSGQRNQNAANSLAQQSAASQAQNQATQTGLTNAAQGTLSQYEGPVQQSPFYKALLNTGISSTSRAYDQADTNMKRQAQAAGFGNQTPGSGVSQGAEDQLRSQEASAIGQLPNQAAIAAAPLGLQAAGTTAGEAATYGNEALGYGTEALNANQLASKIAAQNASSVQGLWKSIVELGLD